MESPRRRAGGSALYYRARPTAFAVDLGAIQAIQSSGRFTRVYLDSGQSLVLDLPDSAVQDLIDRLAELYQSEFGAEDQV